MSELTSGLYDYLVNGDIVYGKTDNLLKNEEKFGWEVKFLKFVNQVVKPFG